MPIYKPSELRLFLNELGIAPNKGLSQNFLIDGNILRKIVTTSNVQPSDIILEIGPGPGSLTQMLLEAGATVIAVEKDIVLANALERLQTPDKRLVIHCHDIMTLPLDEIISSAKVGDKKLKIIANLPYHLTTPILTRFIPLYRIFSSLTVMVQDEVGRRMTALPGTSAYSSLTLFLNFYSDPHYGFTVGRKCFYPAPKVDSAVVVLNLKKPPLEEEESEVFFKLTRTGFEQRRKMLRASVKELYSPKLIEEGLTAIGQSPTIRPEMLSLEEFLKLFKYLVDAEK